MHGRRCGAPFGGTSGHEEPNERTYGEPYGQPQSDALGTARTWPGELGLVTPRERQARLADVAQALTRILDQAARNQLARVRRRRVRQRAEVGLVRRESEWR